MPSFRLGRLDHLEGRALAQRREPRPRPFDGSSSPISDVYLRDEQMFGLVVEDGLPDLHE